MHRIINIEGKHLRWIISGAVKEYFEQGRQQVDKEQFDYYVSDTCNRVHKYLTSGGGQGADGTASDFQCVLCAEISGIYGHPKLGDEVTVWW